MGSLRFSGKASHAISKAMAAGCQDTLFTAIFWPACLSKTAKANCEHNLDDVPRSAYRNGLPVLDKYGIKGTFYVAMGLSSGEAQGGGEAYLSLDEVRDLHARGHDISCHTFSHYPLSEGSAEGAFLDSQRNVEAFNAVLDGVPIEHFSYPFGQVNFREKRLLSGGFKTMRSSRPGMNAGWSDLNLLKATPISNPRFDPDALRRLIDRAVAEKAWLVFYTHGVEENPDDYGCTPDQLEWVVKQCKESEATSILSRFRGLSSIDLAFGLSDQRDPSPAHR